MRKLYLMLCLLTGFSIAASAQCIVSPVAINPSADSLPFFSPSSDDLPCTNTGWGAYITDTLYFTTFSRLNNFSIDSLTIDSIDNLPPGLCWATNSADNTFAGGQNGVLLIIGQPGAYPGQYKLQVYVHATTDLFTIPSATVENLTGSRYYMRVICPGNPCPAVDTSGGKDSLYIPYTQSLACNAGINEVNHSLNNLSIVPNPFSNSSTVTFNSDAEGTFTLRMTDLLGATISSKSIDVAEGSNKANIERNGLSAGMYILSVSNSNGSVNSKVVIE
jgi:hypothetical protein